MKKVLKLVALVMAVSMIAALATCTAFAAGSKEQQVDLVISDDVEDGEVYIDQTYETAEEQKAAETFDEATAADIVNHESNVKNFDVVSVFDLNDDRDAADKGKPITLTFKWKLAANQRGYVFHFTNGAWKYMGEVNKPITFSNFSPVAIVVESNIADKDMASDIIADTGDNNMTLAIICAAVVALGAAGTAVTVSLKKKKA